MNKLTTRIAGVIFATFLMLNSASAEFRVGLAMNTGAFWGNAEETLKDSSRKTAEEGVVPLSYSSVFAEYSLGDIAYGLTIGIEYAADSMELNDETVTKLCQISKKADGVRGCQTNGGAGGDTGTQKADAGFEDLMTMYLQVPMGGTGGYIKAGVSQVDVISKESLSTGSTYGNKTIDGVMAGIGYQGNFDSFFYRLEAKYLDFEAFQLTGSEVGGTSGSYNKIDGEVGGVTGSLAVGYQF